MSAAMRDATDIAPGLPSGTVTFCFTDIEGSTALVTRIGDAAYRPLLEAHRALLRTAWSEHFGHEMGTEGDSFFVVFANAADAVAACIAGQRALVQHPWPDGCSIRVRMGLHTGSAVPRGGDYTALAVHHAARVAASVSGGQVVVSDATRVLVEGRSLDGVYFDDLGEHRLKDVDAPLRLWQVHGEGLASEFPPLRTISNTNLPRPASSFIGRDEEVAELRGLLLGDARLVTVTGPGGAGKTRLALEAAAELVTHFKAGVFWVDLASLQDSDQVVEVVAAVVGAPADLAEHIGDRDLLILLDNFEQVVAAAPTLASLVEGCPRLRLLVTSRERLRVRGEVNRPVGSLPEADAAALFCDRACLELTDGIQRLCRTLDDLPLAIELAAARTSSFSVEQILDRLGSRLDLLKGGRDADPRQQTLRATIAWSYELLAEDERAQFVRLAVFAGGYTLEAAEKVADAEPDQLQSLVDKSLVHHAGERFLLLQTIREFGMERLRDSGELDEMQRRHAGWFLDLARAAHAQLHSRDQRVWLDRLRVETDNMRALLDWTTDHDIGGGLKLAETLLVPWRMGGQLPELVGWFRRVFTTLPDVDDSMLAGGLEAFGTALFFCEEYDQALERLEQSLAMCRRLGDELVEASVLNRLGSVISARGDLARATELREHALAISRQRGDQQGVARSLHLIGEDLRDTGDLVRATTVLEEALRIDTDRGDQHSIMTSLHSLGDVWLDRSDPTRAHELYREALNITHLLADDRSQVYCLAGLAAAAALRGDTPTAGRLWASAERLERSVGLPMLAMERVRYEHVLAPFEHDARFQDATRDAQHLSIEEIVEQEITI
jgi:predicted ATPase/class 3 adenylate cyclase